MALTPTQFQAWLESDAANRCMLVEVTANIAGVETVLYLSNRSYNTTSTDVPANTAYLPFIKNSLDYTERLPIDGQATLSFGDISVENVGGLYDIWATYVWVNRPISIFIGDPRDIRDNFTKIYGGLVEDIAFDGRDTVNISIRSILERLNTPVTSTKVGGTGNNKDLLRPLVFGEVHNIQPVQISASTLTYMVHNGPIERLIEVRDNGVPLMLGTGYTQDLTTGQFSLLRAPAGIITCSVQGEQNTINASTGNIISGGYANTVTKIIQLIIRKYGTTPILPSEMSLLALADFDNANNQPVGVYLTQTTNVIAVCQQLARSVGAQFTSTRTGLITLLKIVQPISNAGSRAITDNDIIANSLLPVQKLPVRSSIRIGYAKNWTIQDALLTGVPEEHKQLYKQEYLLKTVTDSAVRALYFQSEEPDTQETLLLTDSVNGITNEANRLLTLWKTPRFIYRMECTAKFLTLALGEVVTLTHVRFNLSSTKDAQVISIQTNWDTGRVILEVLV